MIMLEKRPQPSRAWTYATPLMAVVLTMLCGGLLFAALVLEFGVFGGKEHGKKCM